MLSSVLFTCFVQSVVTSVTTICLVVNICKIDISLKKYLLLVSYASLSTFSSFIGFSLYIYAECRQQILFNWLQQLETQDFGQLREI
jgi:hypothetical protein